MADVDFGFFDHFFLKRALALDIVEELFDAREVEVSAEEYRLQFFFCQRNVFVIGLPLAGFLSDDERRNVRSENGVE